LVRLGKDNGGVSYGKCTKDSAKYLKDRADATRMNECAGAADTRDGLGDDVQKNKAVVAVTVEGYKDLQGIVDVAFELWESLGARGKELEAVFWLNSGVVGQQEPGKLVGCKHECEDAHQLASLLRTASYASRLLEPRSA
jgi:hypothetical protein